MEIPGASAVCASATSTVQKRATSAANLARQTMSARKAGGARPHTRRRKVIFALRRRTGFLGLQRINP